MTKGQATIALFRAREDAERSAAGLAALGLESVIAPVTVARATKAVPAREKYDAVVTTSAKAFELMSVPARDAIFGLPLFVVGAQTARAAAAKGLQLADAPAVDGAALTAILRARLAAPSKILYLAGRDRRREFEQALGEAGHAVTPVEVYVAEAREAWAAGEAEAVLRCDAALHYSRRSAELAARLAERAGASDHFAAMLHICLSEDAAAPLGASGARRVSCARSPQQDALFEALVGALVDEGIRDR